MAITKLNLVNENITALSITATESIVANTLHGTPAGDVALQINDRLQVANAVSTYATISTVGSNLANTNAYIASTQGNIDTLTGTVNSNLANTNAYIASNYTTLWSALTSTNTSIRSSISSEVASLVDSAPATLDTLNELAAALGDDPNFATSIAGSLAGKLGATASITLTGDVSGSGSFSANAVSITTTVADDSHNHIILSLIHISEPTRPY